MKIVIDFSTAYKTDKALSIFTRECWEDIALLQPAVEFIFLMHKESRHTAKNITIERFKRTGLKWLDKLRLKKALRKWQADRFVTISELGLHSIHPRRQRHADKQALVDQWILFASNGAGQTQFRSLPGLVTIVRPACRTVVTSLSWTEAESVKTQFTGGRSFFLFAGNISEQHQLVDLLKAFSSFKKWQLSNMQLVIAGYPTAWTQVLEEKLLTYKYKSDVVILKDLAAAEMAKLVGASYAMVYPSATDSFPLGLMWGVQSGKAIIASASEVNRQLTPFAEWVHKNDTEKGFAKAMILLYKDEKRQQQLARQSGELAAQMNRRQLLAEVWTCIEK